MSGSPVYIDGKLAGALSLKFGIFTKEPLARRDSDRGHAVAAEAGERPAGARLQRLQSLRRGRDSDAVASNRPRCPVSRHAAGYPLPAQFAGMSAMAAPILEPIAAPSGVFRLLAGHDPPILRRTGCPTE